MLDYMYYHKSNTYHTDADMDSILNNTLNNYQTDVETGAVYATELRQ